MGWFSPIAKEGDRKVAFAFFSSMIEWNNILKESVPLPINADLYPPRPGFWAMEYRAVHEIPIADSELWERENLPLAGPNAYPVVMRYGRSGLRKPDAKRLAFLEGILRTLVLTTEDEIDSAEWERTVETDDGPRAVRLAMPLLTLPIIPDNPAPPEGPILDFRSMERLMLNMSRHMAAERRKSMKKAGDRVRKRFVGNQVTHVPGSTPLEQAQDVIYQAFEVRGRRRIQMARRALEICPECADAHATLAESAFDDEEALRRYDLGVETGRRNLGPRIFDDPLVTFWARLETRPFMRALLGRAQLLMQRGEYEGARRDMEELLELNPGDNQGVRYSYLELLLLSRADRDLLKFEMERREDLELMGPYARALALYRLDPASRAAADALRKAVDAHRLVALFLLGLREPPVQTWLTTIYRGSEEEVAWAVDHLRKSWERTEGAMDWLRRVVPDAGGEYRKEELP